MLACLNDGKEKAGGQPGNFSATTTKHIVYCPTNRDAEKCLSTWQARYAIFGHTLYRTTSADGTVLYLASRWGMVREMKSLEEVATFLALIGGKL